VHPQATGPGKLSGGFDHQSGTSDQSVFCKAHLYGCTEQLRMGVWYVGEGMEEEWSG
jgi:hypothetical protein